MITNGDCNYNEDYKYIKENLEQINYRISRAAAKAGRKPEDITLVAVTKTVDPRRIKYALECGVKDAGENWAQELCQKYNILGDACRWHMIGHLQRNKVRHIIDKVKLIHSVDSTELAFEINRRATEKNIVMPVLVQVNVSGEDTKFGINGENLKELLISISPLKNIKVKGLMTIAPFEENPENTRWVFDRLRNLSIDICKENIDNINMDFLSMGMSNDFEAAIEEGSNIVRIGSAVFGRRQY